MILKWDKRFLDLAHFISGWSKDPSTKVGAVIANLHKTAVGLGYNGFPRGVHDHAHRYEDRDVKYPMVVHAEINAILNAGQSVRGFTMYCTMFPCPQCAAYIIQSGIIRVVAMTSPSDARWKEGHDLARKMFSEAGVDYETVGG